MRELAIRRYQGPAPIRIVRERFEPEPESMDDYRNRIKDRLLARRSAGMEQESVS